MERLVAGLFFLGALGYVWLARDFEAGFIADPIGPRAFPFAIGALLLATSVALWTSRASSILDRTGHHILHQPPSPLRAVSWRHGVLLAALFLYVGGLDRLGFVVATTALSSTVVVLFSGPTPRGVVLSFLLSLSIFALFVYVLSIPLPRGF